jgi:hypothetical protein
MINANTIAANLNAGTNFAGIEYVTDVTLSADARKAGFVAKKHTVANVQLFGKINNMELFAQQVNRDTGLTNFVQSDNWFEHTDKFSIVQHKKNGNKYLYGIFNHAKSTFTINGVEATRDDVATLCTASVAKKLLDKSGIVHNQRNNVSHSVHCRTIALSNLVRVSVNNQVITVK